MRYVVKFIAAALIGVSAVTVMADSSPSGRFNLGELVVVGQRQSDRSGVATVAISQEEVWTYHRPALDDLLNLVPGVTSTIDANGRRNEADIFVRGFNRLQVPLMIDGVRVYLPADNRLDFRRFLTTDIAEVQIHKGYASVIDGPGMMGGAINLVTRKPTGAVEAEAQGSLELDRDGDQQAWTGYLRGGSLRKNYYVHGSLTYTDRDFWTLPSSYDPAPGSLEDGGRRQSADSRDWSMNIKAGLLPNATDEYSLNYTRQEGAKGAPLNVYNNPPVPGNSFWRWPWWNVQSIAALSNTQLGRASWVKTKLYYNTFENALDAFDDANYAARSRPGRFRSYYDDYAYGVSLQAGTELVPMNSLKSAFHYRADVHRERSLNQPSNPVARFLEPEQDQSQDTWSVAVEDTVHLLPAVDFVVGLSYDEYWINEAQDFNGTTARLFDQPHGGADAFNWQMAAIWRYSASGQAHASVSDRARFPTIFELYSTRFGTAVPNPNLDPERARNVELGVKDMLTNKLRIDVAVFYNDLRDLIETVELGPGITQTQNAGDGHSYGTDVALEAQLHADLRLGGNYSYIHRELSDPAQPFLRATGVPRHKGFLYLRWRPTAHLEISPNLELASERWSDFGTNPVQPFPFIQTGAYTLANLQVDYTPVPGATIAFGARNLLDDEYELAWGLPQPGRSYYLKAQLRY